MPPPLVWGLRFWARRALGRIARDSNIGLDIHAPNISTATGAVQSDQPTASTLRAFDLDGRTDCRRLVRRIKCQPCVERTFDFNLGTHPKYKKGCNTDHRENGNDNDGGLIHSATPLLLRP